MTERSATLIHIATPQPVRLWGGVGLFRISPDDEFDPGGLYNQLDPNGAWVTGLPVMRQLVGGTAEALDFTFSGVPLVPQTWVDEKAANGCRLYFGEIDLDADGRQDGPVWIVWSGIIRAAAAEDGPDVATITVTVETACASRRRASLRTWSQADHIRRHPGDNFCYRVTRNGLNNTIAWP